MEFPLLCKVNTSEFPFPSKQDELQVTSNNKGGTYRSTINKIKIEFNGLG